MNGAKRSTLHGFVDFDRIRILVHHTVDEGAQSEVNRVAEDRDSSVHFDTYSKLVRGDIYVLDEKASTTSPLLSFIKITQNCVFSNIREYFHSVLERHRSTSQWIIISHFIER